jgi:hypothetical protein
MGCEIGATDKQALLAYNLRRLFFSAWRQLSFCLLLRCARRGDTRFPAAPGSSFRSTIPRSRAAVPELYVISISSDSQ